MTTALPVSSGEPAGLADLKRDAARLHMLSFSPDHDEFVGQFIEVALNVIGTPIAALSPEVQAAWEVVKAAFESAPVSK